MDPRTQETANSTGKRRHDDSRDNNDGEGEVCALAKRPKTPFTRQSSIQSWYTESSSSTGLTASSYTVAWICAIPCELAAAMAMLDETHPHLRDQPAYDSNHYTLGSIGGHHVAVACLPTSQYGTVNAANVVINLKRTFPCIRICLMVGVGGGVPGLTHDIRLGDVVVGIRVMPYELGKVGAGGQIQHTNSCLTLDHSISTLLSTIRAKHELAPSRVPSIVEERFSSKSEYRRPGLSDYLYQATYNHVASNTTGHCDTCDTSKVLSRRERLSTAPEIHYGAIASGDKLMKNGLARDELARRLDVICFEMEAAGLMAVMPCLPIRGICDYSDSHKSKDWQKYAAAAAAAYARELLEEMPTASAEASRVVKKQFSVRDELGEESMQKQRAEILSSLAFDQFDARRQTIKRAQAKTCQWFLRTPEYKHWQDRAHHDDHRGFLWIRGKPGVGKSTMMKFLFDNARKSERRGCFNISFFFNARGDTLEKSVSGMYRSLLLQLLKRCTDLQAVLDDPYVILRSENGPLPLDILKDLFQTAISLLGGRSLTCFVDALDEGDEQQIIDMVQFFEEIAEQSAESGIQFKTCLSSRHYPYIDVKYGLRLSLEEQDGHRDDLINYVRANLRVKDTEMLEDLLGQLIEKSQGVFLWLKLVVSILIQENKRGRLAMKKRLAEIPPGLSDLFRDILARDTKNVDDLRLGIAWILFAKRPLRPLEYHHALWAGLAKSGNADEDMPDATANDAEDCAEMCVLSSSKGLAEVTQRREAFKAAGSGERVVQFIHESVRDYLLNDGGMHELWPDLVLNLEVQSHEQLKQCCIFYLKHQATTRLIVAPSRGLVDTDFNTAKSVLSPSLSFLEYASQHVLSHADGAAAAFPQDETIKLYSPRDWSNLYNMYEKYSAWRYDSSTRLIYMLADKGLANLIHTRIRTESPHRLERGVDFRYPLFAALSNENESAAAAILGITSADFRSGDYAKCVKLNDHPAGPGYGHLSPLSWAAGQGLSDIILALIKQGVDVNERDPTSKTPLDSALAEGELDAARILFNNGAWRAAPQNLEKGAVQAAAFGDESLIKSIARISTATMGKALYVAFDYGHEEMGRMMIAHGVTLDDPGDIEYHMKGYRGNYEVMVKHLIHDEKDSNVRSKNAEKILFWAARLGLEPESGLHIPDGVHVDCLNSDQDTPFIYALMHKRWTTAEFLLTKGADPNVRSSSRSRTPLHIASMSRATESLIRLLLARGADTTARDEAQRTPLHCASSLKCNEVVVSLLLDHGSAVNAKNTSGDTPLLNAASLSCDKVVAALLRRGADADVAGVMRLRPLDIACIQGNNLMVAELTSRGCGNVNALSLDLAPLHRASTGGNVEIVRLLLLAGADASIRTTELETPLHLAAAHGRKAVVSALLETRQCDVDAKNEDGITPLFAACKADRGEVVELLLEWAANPRTPNKRGVTPYDIAKKRKCWSLFDQTVPDGVDGD